MNREGEFEDGGEEVPRASIDLYLAHGGALSS
jgi:hypothetical protein